MISIDEHHEAIACVSDIDLVIKPDANLDHNNNNNPLPNFSIRDYVYSSRCKDITCNWPFSSENLQLCLKSGVKNLLPPFESLESLRIYSYIAKNRVPNEDTVTILDDKSTDNRLTSLASSSIKSQCHFEEKTSHIKSISQPAIMKSNSSVDLVNDIIMPTKVCPVCKTFTSSSNNTLNAHIDRCLSGESSIKLSSESCPKIKTFKHRIKPRNTRLMSDIYKTAKRCTIEELDRRNGTNWATSSSFPDQELEFQADGNKDEPRELAFVPEISEHEDHEGDVYIDKNGTKVRILSTLNFSKLDDNEARMLQNREKNNKFVKKKTKKGDVRKRGRKILKFRPSSSKVSSKKISKKIVDKQVISGEEGNAVTEKSCNKEDEGEKRMKIQLRKRMDDLAITRPPWACSKRTGVAKKRKFQDSLKQKSSMEENVSEKLSFDHPVNDLGAKKKKSVTSISSNENYSSARFEITSELSAGIDQVPFLRSFTGLKNSMDEEFSNMVDDDNENRESYNFSEVDPIPIPGPPGSFLPLSPFADDMVSEEDEIQGNSSLTTTSRVLSSDQDHNRNDITNRDLISDSPISNVSSPAPQDTKSANSTDHNLRSVVGMFKEKHPSPNHCRCSIKNSPNHHQESRESREFERVFESNTRPKSLSLTLPPPLAFKSPADLSINIPVSPTTPVLRLMGKNLIVTPSLGSSPMGHNPFRSIQNEDHGSMTPPHFARSFSDLRPSRTTGDLMAPANCSRFDSKMEISAIDDDLSENKAGDHMFYDYIMQESRRKQPASSACYRRSFSIPTARKEDRV